MKKRYLKIFPISLVVFFTSMACSAQINTVGPVGITVKDLDQSVKFYCDLLGFKKVAEQEYSGSVSEKLEGVFGMHSRVAKLQLGDEYIELTDYITSGGRSIPEDQHSNDLFFQHIAIVVSDMEKAFDLLKKYKVEFVSTAPQTLPLSNTAAAGIKAFYFHDLDNHNLEIIYFPKGKGNPKWQVNNKKIFLGIDHTAIGISNTEISEKFYTTVLGFVRKGDSWNFGTEQEHLNNVEGASLHITGLKTTDGPGVEFLQYLKPGPGKLYPADTKANDIWYWQTTLYTHNATALYNTLKTSGYTFVSSELVQVKEKNVLTSMFIVKDPDGHALLIKESH